jgi:predicted  nucleic acid-binding Zn-ribbon protein
MYSIIKSITHTTGETTMAKHRPVEQRIAETMKQLASLQAKANADAVNADPRILAIGKRIREINNSMLKFNRWNTEWEQKVEDFENRVATWVERGEIAKEKIKEANKQLVALKEERQTLSEDIAQEIANAD